MATRQWWHMANKKICPSTQDTELNYLNNIPHYIVTQIK